MQFDNRLPFSQHLVPRYSESPAGKKNLVPPLNSVPSFRHWWKHKKHKWKFETSKLSILRLQWGWICMLKLIVIMTVQVIY